MLPHLLLLLLWVVVAVAWPLLQTLHALQASSEHRRQWLCYWMCYAGAMWLAYRCEPLYSFVSCTVPFYGEAHLLLMLFLVSPRTSGIARLHEAAGRAFASAVTQSSTRALQSFQKAMAADLKTSTPAQDTLGEAPGTYCIVAPAAVTSTFEPTQETIVKQLSVGETVQVLSVVRDGQRLRARVREPAGWISLLNTESGKRWAQSCEGTATQGRGLEDGLAMAAASVGCDPSMLFGNIGQAAGKAPAEVEVDAAAAWEAAALLESQLQRADDPSEAPGARQAASLLKTMLVTLASGGNPAALNMAKALVPDIGTIWAHEGAREYLRALLLGPDHAPCADGGGATGSPSADPADE